MAVQPRSATTRGPSKSASAKPNYRGVEGSTDIADQHMFKGKPKPFMGSPTTPLHFDMHQRWVSSPPHPVKSEMSQYDQAVLQAQLLSNMRANGMTTGMHQAQFLMILEHLRQAYTLAGGDQQEFDSNARSIAAAQQLEPPPLQRDDPPVEPSTIALLQQKFAQLEKHKEMQKNNQAQKVQLFPSQWSNSTPQQSPLPSPATSPVHPYAVAAANGAYYPVQQQGYLSGSASPEPPFTANQEGSWRNQASVCSPVTGWAGATSPQNADTAPNPTMYFAQKQPIGGYQQQSHRAIPGMGLLGSILASPGCEQMCGHSVGENKNTVEQYVNNNQVEGSPTNFPFCMSTRPNQTPPTATSNTSAGWGNSLHFLPQSTKSAFVSFARPVTTIGDVLGMSVPPVGKGANQSCHSHEGWRWPQDGAQSNEMYIDSIDDELDTSLHL